ncbi:Insulin-induced protein 2 protein, partial [Goodea atripinnis]
CREMSRFSPQMSSVVSSPQSAMIGMLYPCIDRRLGEPHKFKREWSSVMRCVAVFV